MSAGIFVREKKRDNLKAEEEGWLICYRIVVVFLRILLILRPSFLCGRSRYFFNALLKLKIRVLSTAIFSIRVDATTSTYANGATTMSNRGIKRTLSNFLTLGFELELWLKFSTKLQVWFVICVMTKTLSPICMEII